MTLWSRLVERFVDAPRRRTDLRLLWPTCKSEALKAGKGLDEAKACFFLHADNDLAWRRRYSHDELIGVVGALE